MKLVVYTAHENPFWQVPDRKLTQLKRAYPQLQVVFPDTTDDLCREIADAEIYFGWALPERAWNAATQLRWIHTPQIGVGRLSRLDGIERIIVTNADQMDRRPVAQLALTLFLSLYFGIPDAVRLMDAKRWAFDEMAERLSTTRNRRLHDMCACVVGYGGIGRPLVDMISGFFREVVVVRKTGLAIPRSRVYTLDQWQLFLPETDVLFLCIPSDADSRKFLDRNRIDRFARPPFVVNVGRGSLVDEESLSDALHSGRILGYATDVTNPEPPSPESRLWTAPGVLMTPHIGAYRPDFWNMHLDIFEEKLSRFFQYGTLDSVF